MIELDGHRSVLQGSGGRSKGKGLLVRPRIKWDNCRVLDGDLKERDYLEDLELNGTIAGFWREI